jgi:hypothetical protein
MRKLVVLVAVLLALGAWTAPGQAAPVIELWEYAFNLDGVVTNGSAPAGVNLAGFDTTTGLGTVGVTVTGAGAHYVAFFADHDINAVPNTFFNEYGSVTGAPGAGLSWEIDEPEHVFGDIYTNFTNGALDNNNAVPQASPDDVSMALGWDFILQVGETATISFALGTTAPGGFFLQQTDPDAVFADPGNVYFGTALRISGGGGQVPEPATLLLLGSGLAGLALLRKRG